MSNFRIWWQASQWLPVVAFVVFAIACVVTSFTQFGSKRQDTFIFFAGIAVGAFGAVFNLILNISSNKVERLVLALPERRSLRTRKTIGWGAVALRAVGLGVSVALGAMYMKSGSGVLFSTAMGFVTGAANAIAMGFSLYKLFVSDRTDEKRRDVVADSQQLGGWPGNQQQQYMPLQQQQQEHPAYGVPLQQSYGPPPQQNYEWQPQPQQQASIGNPQPYYGGPAQQAYGGVPQPQPFQQSGQQQAGFPPIHAYSAQAHSHGQY